MDGSAAVIGEMMLPILEPRSPAATEPARDLGRAFQLTNFLRDVGEDLDRGRLYLPVDDVDRFGADPAGRRVTPAWRALMRFEIDRARRLYTSADAGIALLPPWSARAIAAARTLYAAILDEIEASDYDVFAQPRSGQHGAEGARHGVGPPAGCPRPRVGPLDSLTARDGRGHAGGRGERASRGEGVGDRELVARPHAGGVVVAARRQRLGLSDVARGLVRPWSAGRPRRGGPGRAPPGRRAAGAARHRPDHGRAGHLPVRHRRPEAALAAGHRQRRGELVPVLQRAQRRLRPGVAADPGGARRRRVDRQWPEGVEQRDADGRPGRPRVPHRQRGAQAQGSVVLHHRRPPARHRDPAHQADERPRRVQRDVLHRRPGAGCQPHRWSRQRLGRRAGDAGQRAQQLRRRRQLQRARRPARAAQRPARPDRRRGQAEARHRAPGPDGVPARFGGRPHRPGARVRARRRPDHPRPHRPAPLPRRGLPPDGAPGEGRRRGGPAAGPRELARLRRRREDRPDHARPRARHHRRQRHAQRNRQRAATGLS